MKAKKVMALMLCAAMVTSMSATAAFAAEEKEDAATEESADSTAAEDLETPQKAPAEGTQKTSGHHNSGNDRRSRGISRSRCTEGQK